MNNSREDNYSTPYTQDPDIKFICLGTLSSKNNDSFVSVYPNNYIDDFIERLVEEKETVLPKRNPVISASMLLQLGYESKCLSVMEFFGLDWDLYKWPDFIQNFKNLVHDNTQFYRWYSNGWNIIFKTKISFGSLLDYKRKSCRFKSIPSTAKICNNVVKLKGWYFCNKFDRKDNKGNYYTSEIPPIQIL